MRAHNQEKCKQSILLSLPEEKVFISSDVEYCTDCNHDHNISCNVCEALKEAIEEIHSAIEKYSSKINI